MRRKIPRRTFFLKSFQTGIGMVAFPAFTNAFSEDHRQESKRSSSPIVLSTWKWGVAANEAASKILLNDGTSLEAAEKGVNVAERDPNVQTVGYGGFPNEDGVVELDAAIMEGKRHLAGAVGALQNIPTPISVARKVMEDTKHVMLVGEGALKFARAYGFKEQNLLTEESRNKWLQWKQNLNPVDNWYPRAVGHDTIGLITLDRKRDLSAACTTSGLRWKIPGRVGDSPLIGCGLYVDNEIGAASATGIGEEVIRVCGSFLVVEMMRLGASPQDACEKTLERIIRKSAIARQGSEVQVAFIALDKEGRIGAASLRKGFQYALFKNGKNQLHDSKFLKS
jgi:isoaspartyl peptidase/L-asparaginase-like protein (Ntn-hydrolase superfamily)